MKKLVFPFLVIAVIFSACKKEEETPTNNTATAYAFSCKINGADFTDNNPLATIAQNVLTIDSENGANSIRFMIYFNFRHFPSIPTYLFRRYPFLLNYLVVILKIN